MIVVSDTSVISGLVQSGHLDVLQNLYERIIIPNQVYLELQDLNVAFQQKLALDWIEIREVSSTSLLNELTELLDPGEAEAIVLATELRADLVLIDERKGRAIATQMGLSVIGTLGALVEAKEKNYINSVKPVIDILVNQCGFWIKPSLVERVLKSVNE
ncbi:MAG: DUF3368 domain-containing protein [Dyadobacter sp.]|uniref:DUF3368 domain-containing protein n=1 Tax=Dyadobacter sp. TaxID=1914288 RepID=UPI001B187007|nr:DUF3368 domain-containing protein [Dyadobacter sp.]MBO9612193.1 DUF3368 domain-containing protein [Dyadobacter sp.]